MTQQITKSLLLFLILSVFTLEISAQSNGGVTSGAKDFCTTTNSGFVTVSGYKSTILFWQASSDGGQTWVKDPTSMNKVNFTYFNLAQTTCYRAVVQDGAFPPDTSTVVCITINKPAVAGTIIGGGNFCASAPAGTLALTGNIGTVASWQYSETNGSSWITIPNNVTTTENYPALIQDRMYRVIVQNGASCKKDTSQPVSFKINKTTVAGSISGATSVCAKNNNGTLSISGNIGNIVEWQSSTDNGASWQIIANTTASQSYLNLTTTTWYKAIVKNTGCLTDTTSTAVINVSATTKPGSLTGGGNFCGSAATGTLILSNNNSTIQYWITSVDSGATWMQLSNTSNTYNYTSVPVTTWYAVVSVSGGCPADTSTIAKVNVGVQTVAGTLGQDRAICFNAEPDSLLLTGKFGDVQYWLQSNNGSTWKAIANKTEKLVYKELTQTTWYTAVVRNGQCKIDTAAPVKITVFPKTIVDAGVGGSITEGQSIPLSGLGTGMPEWYPAASLSDAFIFNPVAKPIETTTYTLAVTDTNNCIARDTVTVIVIKLRYQGKITNLFTPNGDGINDNWFIEGIEKFPDNEVFVYNIYGQQVYTKKGYTNDWKGTYNGTELPDGTYYYVLRFDSSDVVYKGSVDILRNK